MFEHLYKPLPDTDKYLARLGLMRPIPINLESLNTLIYAHLTTIPFENLDIYDLEADISLGIEDIYNKIVEQGRGGYCFELNGLFMALLQSLGFECHPLAGRVLWLRDYYPPLGHRVTMVEMEGRRYYCDVGFGGPAPCSALCLDDAGEQISGGKTFRFDRSSGDTILSYRNWGGVLEPLLMFSEKPCNPVDFVLMNEYFSKNNKSSFRSKRIANLLTKDGSISIDGNIFRQYVEGDCIEIVLDTNEQTLKTLSEHFGIRIGYPLKRSAFREPY
ncbi:MAG TPA: arylamine N-acetyltransferase [Clostridiales bacterium]|nr:arylamine N-acetyltransferase [Clostridiales bacterium]